MATITTTTRAPIAVPVAVPSDDWKDKPIAGMTNPELMAIAIVDWRNNRIPAIVELTLRAERANPTV
jgi:hypothetical protein